jgi:hypothetical protein
MAYRMRMDGHTPLYEALGTHFPVRVGEVPMKLHINHTCISFVPTDLYTHVGGTIQIKHCTVYSYTMNTVVHGTVLVALNICSLCGSCEIPSYFNCRKTVTLFVSLPCSYLLCVFLGFSIIVGSMSIGKRHFHKEK